MERARPGSKASILTLNFRTALLLLSSIHIVVARAWSGSDLLYAEATLYMADGIYFSSACHLMNPRSTVCNPDHLLSDSESTAIDKIVQNIAHGVGDYALPSLKGPRRGRYIAVVVLREVSAPSLSAFAAQVYQQWALLKCGQPQWSGCSNSVVLVVATAEKAVAAYAGQSTAAVEMAHDFTRVQDEMGKALGLWREDALSSAVATGVESIGHMTKYVEAEADDLENYTFLTFLLFGFVVAAACALQGVRDAPT